MEFIFNNNVLGVNIKHLRKQKKLTQGALCEVIGSKPTTLSNWETGFSTPELDKIVQLSKYFGISLDNLILMPHEKWNQSKSEILVHNPVCALCQEKDRTISVLEEINSLLKERIHSKTA